MDNNREIFEYLNPVDNVDLSDLETSDRVNLLMALKKYYLEYRDILGISHDITFGLEMEFENADVNVIDRNITYYFGYDWCVVPEDSITNGAEVNSPILIDCVNTWDNLRKICNIVGKNASVMDNTSAHMHIGTQILGNNPKYWRNFALLWATYENIIFRFLYGEFISGRSVIEKYAKPVSLDYINDIEGINIRANFVNAGHMFKLLDKGEENIKLRRRKSINFTNVSGLQPYLYDRCVSMNTIECRCPNGTFDPVIWQNNVNFIVKLMLYCKSDKFDDKIILRRMTSILEDNIPSNLYKYSRIYYEQALELADLIFDNNLDKIYFLRQYIKDGMVSSKPLVRSLSFTKK